MMQHWHTGILGLFCIALENIVIHGINQSWIEKTSTEGLKIDPKSFDSNTEGMRF